MCDWKIFQIGDLTLSPIFSPSLTNFRLADPTLIRFLNSTHSPAFGAVPCAVGPKSQKFRNRVPANTPSPWSPQTPPPPRGGLFGGFAAIPCKALCANPYTNADLMCVPTPAQTRTCLDRYWLLPISVRNLDTNLCVNQKSVQRKR